MLSDENSALWKLTGITSPLILASRSPRRADILRAVGCPFEIASPEADEGSYIAWDGGRRLAENAAKKAQSVASRFPDRLVLAADTVVRLGREVFGKPETETEAEIILTILSGRKHEVCTALHLIRFNRKTALKAFCQTAVEFRKLTVQEIRAYLKTGEPMDKAGAYGIQSIGGLWVKRIEGCYFNVVGLPIATLWDMLMQSRGEMNE